MPKSPCAVFSDPVEYVTTLAVQIPVLVVLCVLRSPALFEPVFLYYYEWLLFSLMTWSQGSEKVNLTL